MKNKLKSNLEGFTLVELLVVIAILAVLVSVTLAGFRSSQARGRDAERKSDLKQISSSLELYYSDYGEYPDTLPWGAEFTDGKTVYFKIVPTDPLDGPSYLYRVDSTNQKFQLFGYLENTEDPDLIVTAQACGNKTCNFSITSSNTTPSDF